jgi:mono/diheme cytochrome c family protein
MKAATSIASCLGVAAALTACGTSRRGEPFSSPMAVQEERLLAGRRSFQTHCHHCHPGGEGGLGPALNNKPLPGFLMAFPIRNGLGAMPSFSEETISDQQVSDVVHYLKVLRKNRPPSTH